MTSLRILKTLALTTSISASFLLPSPAQLVTWDGNGDSNNSGDWDVAANWDTGVPTSSDDAVLDNVTSGTRTVTVTSGNPQTVEGLTMTQSSAGSVNALAVNDDLTVTSASDDPLALTSTAGQDAIVVDIAAGKTLAASRSSGVNISAVDGTFNLAAGASLTHAAPGDTADITHNGPINAGTNTVLEVAGDSASLTLNGDSSFGAGSVVKLTYTNDNGNAIFTNNAALNMDEADLEFAWEAANSGSPGDARKFVNTGTWVLTNGSGFVLSSTTGRPTTGGFNVSQFNENSGTLRLESGSTMDIRGLYNTGTTQLGSNTAGVSDAEVTLGGQATSPAFFNGQTAAGSDAPGVLNILGDAILGPATLPGGSPSTTNLNNGSSTSTGSIINVGNGSAMLTFTIQNAYANIINYAGNTINLKANSTTLLKSLLSNNTGGITTIENRGLIAHAGSLQIQGNKTGTRSITTTSTGTYQVSGTSAVLQNNESTSGPTGSDLTLVFENSGVLSGATASDKLTYVNATSKTAYDTLAMNQTGGKVTPGLGTNGAGVSSIGSLELVNTDLTLSSGVTMEFDIGGTPGSGSFDSLVLSGTGAVLDLGLGATLDVWTVNGFTLTSGTYQIATASSVTGVFGALMYNGAAASGQYNVNYLSNAVQIEIVPEPSTALLLLGGLAMGLMTFRRRRQA